MTTTRCQGLRRASWAAAGLAIFAGCGDGASPTAAGPNTSVTASTVPTTVTSASTTTTPTTVPAKGELRGKLTPSVDIPGGGKESASGTVVLSIDGPAGRACAEITLKEIGDGTEAHVHNRTSDEVVLTYDVRPLSSGLPFRLESTTVKECAPVDASVLAALLRPPAQFYLDVHTREFPDGALRAALAR